MARTTIENLTVERTVNGTEAQDVVGGGHRRRRVSVHFGPHGGGIHFRGGSVHWGGHGGYYQPYYGGYWGHHHHHHHHGHH